MATTLDLKIRFQALENLSQKAKGMMASLSGLEKKLSRNREKMEAMNRQMKDISAYRKQEKSLSELAANMEKARQKARELKEQWKASRAEGNIAAMKKLAEAHEKATQKVRGMAAEHERMKTKLGAAATKLREAGLNTNRLGEAEQRLAKQSEHLGRVLERQGKQMQRNIALRKQLKRAAETRDRMTALGGNLSMTGAVSYGAAHRAGSTLANMFMPGIDFDYQMAKVAAIARVEKGTAAYDALRNQAKTLGATTMFTATQAAAGQEFLARAGYSQQAIINSMPGMLALAQSAGMDDLARVADIASNIGGAFKINPEDAKAVEHLTDVLSNTAASANVDLAMLGETMKYLAQASDLNLTLEQAAAMSGALGNVGIQGTQAGTALRAMLVRSVGPAKAARKAMKSIGISFTDTGDQVKNFEQILSQLNEKTKHMGNAQRAAIIKDIFGTEAVSAITELLNQQKTGMLQNLIRANEQSQGVNKKMAEEMTNSAKGDLLALQSAWEGLQIEMFEGNNSPLRDLLQEITALIRISSRWIKENPDTIRQLVKMAAVLVMVAGGAGLLMLTLSPLIAGLGLLRFVIALAGFSVTKLLFWPLGALAGMFKAATLLLARFVFAIGKGAVVALTRFATAAGTAAVAAGRTLLSALGSLAAFAAGAAKTALIALGNAMLWVGRAFLIAGRFMLANPLVAVIAAAVAAALWLYSNWDTVCGKLTQLWEGIQDWWKNSTIGKFIEDTFLPAIKTVIGWVETLFQKIQQAWEKLKELMGFEAINHVEVQAQGVKQTQALQSELEAKYPAMKHMSGEERTKVMAAAAMSKAYSGNGGQSYGASMGEAMRKAYGGAAKAAEQKPPKVTPAPTVARPAPVNNHQTSTINIHLDVDGMGNKEAIALIRSEIGKEILAKQREMAARGRSSMYDAALA